jgi:hypothetical protein
MWTFQALISDLNPKGRWLRSREDGIWQHKAQTPREAFQQTGNF